MNKCEARSFSLAMRKKYDLNLASINAIDEIINMDIINNYSNIGIYYPIGREISILKLLKLFPDKKFYLPITKDEISFARYKLGDQLVKGPFKTMEPVGDVVCREEIEVFFIPCVAISKDNKRIGYGKGYYDRYLAGYNGIKIGICYKELSELDVLCDSFDVELDYKIKGWLNV
mgnify:CR=1 FL=1